jgi:hypothetical protein
MKLCLPAALIAIVIALFCCRSPATAQSEQEKVEAAKKEGAVYWYGSMNVDDASALIAGLNKKYPFMEIKRFRAANAPAKGVRKGSKGIKSALGS